jgi:hypothetical protein
VLLAHPVVLRSANTPPTAALVVAEAILTRSETRAIVLEMPAFRTSKVQRSDVGTTFPKPGL